MAHEFTAEQIAAVIADYRAGTPVTALARRFHCRSDSITTVLDAHGLISRSRGGARRRRYTPEQEAEIVRRYTAGETAMGLARAFGGSTPSISNVLKRHGITKRHRTGRPAWRIFTPEQAQEMGRLWHDGLSQTAIAKRFETTQWTVSKVLIEHGIQPVSRRGNQPGTNRLAGKQRGGQHLTPQGYVFVKIPPDHPFAVMRHSSGYVPEHRLVMAQALGRPLREDETVHHKNGRKDDNRPANLQLRQGKHGKGVVLVCGDCGSQNIVTAKL